MSDDLDAVTRANAAFYAAFEARDLDAMRDVWEHSDRSAVVHPGWPSQQGWARVLTTWDAIFSNPEPMHCLVLDERVEVIGSVGIVTCEEQLLQGLGHDAPEGDDLASARVAATNVFVRVDDAWKMILHHGSGIFPGGATPGDDELG